MGGTGGGGLRDLIRRGRRPTRAEPAGRCELCAAPVPDRHRHLLDREARRPRCVCRPCAVLFDRAPSPGKPQEKPQEKREKQGKQEKHEKQGEPRESRYVLIPDRRRHLPDLRLDDAVWAALAVPVRILFAYQDSAEGRVVVRYPSPAGAVEAAVEPGVWAALERANPVLRDLAPDVQALLVDRRAAAPDHWLVPIDDCHRLVALLRTRWKGLAGGPQVWAALTDFFAELRK